jgi:hypothetical protein
VPLFWWIWGCPAPEEQPEDGDPMEIACDLRQILLADAGPEALDCGSTADGDPVEDVNACTVAAFEAGSAFAAIHEEESIDSLLLSGQASDGATVWFYLFESYWASDPGQVDRFECPNPVVTTDYGLEYVGCEWPTSACRVRVCGFDSGSEGCG